MSRQHEGEIPVTLYRMGAEVNYLNLVRSSTRGGRMQLPGTRLRVTGSAAELCD